MNPSHSETLLEDKLIILYTLSSVKTGLTRTKLSEVILHIVQMNYFDVQRCIDEMINDGLLLELEDDKGRRNLLLTSDGGLTITQLTDTVPDFIRELTDLYIHENRDRLLERTVVDAAIQENGPGDFEAHLSVSENNMCLMALTINTPTKTDAIDLCQKWKANPQKYYAAIIKAFA